MKEDKILNFSLILLVVLGILIGWFSYDIINIKQEQKEELNNILKAENIINECKDRYNQDYIINNDLVIEFVDKGQGEVYE